MKITKVINNNVVSCTDDNGLEVVVMGKGLGFQAKLGSIPDEALVEKVFRMETQKDIDKLKDLLVSLPPEQISLCNTIIAYAKEVLTVHMNQSIYITLTDHICFVIARVKQGMRVQNGLLSEARAFYPQEFAVGRYAVELIEKELHIALPEDEAASIALHLVNAEYDASISQMVRITQVMQELLAIIREDKTLGISHDTLCYDELAIHLKFLVLRTFSGTPDEPSEPDFVRAIRSVYAAEFRCADRVAACLETYSHSTVSQEKRAYLAVNIRRVCHTGG